MVDHDLVNVVLAVERAVEALPTQATKNTVINADVMVLVRMQTKKIASCRTRREACRCLGSPTWS